MYKTTLQCLMHNLAHSQHLCLWGHICVYSVSMLKIIWASIVCVGAFSPHLSSCCSTLGIILPYMIEIIIVCYVACIS
jgi:hypothetical protein